MISEEPTSEPPEIHDEYKTNRDVVIYFIVTATMILVAMAFTVMQ